MSASYTHPILGSMFGCVEFTEVIIERLCCAYLQPMSADCRIDIGTAEWLFIAGVYKSNDQYYIVLRENEKSSSVDQMIEEEDFPNTGIALISEEKAYAIVKKLSEFGKENHIHKFSDFQEILHILVSMIPCSITMTPIENCGGYYDPDEKEIFLANNQTQFCIIGSLIHEYVHYILRDFSEKEKALSIEEYVFDQEETICEAVAYSILRYLWPEFVSNMDAELTEHAKTEAILEKWIETVPEAGKIFSYRMRMLLCGGDTETKLIVEKLTESIKKKYSDIREKCSHRDFEYPTSELFVLSQKENNELYDFIMTEISNMIPPSEGEFETDM